MLPRNRISPRRRSPHAALTSHRYRTEPCIAIITATYIGSSGGSSQVRDPGGAQDSWPPLASWSPSAELGLHP
jgi:hypothetical protein